MVFGANYIKHKELPIIALKDMVVFPNSIVPIFAGREKSINAVNEAMNKGKLILVAPQLNHADDPALEDINKIGTIARILQIYKLPDGTIRVLVEGEQRVHLENIYEQDSLYRARIRLIRQDKFDNEILLERLKKEFSDYRNDYKKLPLEIEKSIIEMTNPDAIIDKICANIPLPKEQKLRLISLTDTKERAEEFICLLALERDKLSVNKQINQKVKRRLEENQRSYILKQQINEIKKQLGEEESDTTGAREIEQKLRALTLPEEVLNRSLKEVVRLSKMQAFSPESGIIRTYLEWICDLPWNRRTEDNTDISKAQEILDQDHFGLDEVKERILDFIAVLHIKKDVKGPILCFVGPPGVGKTSLGRSVARALSREYVRISLGGVRDEAEIRGHRKTYIGAFPGKIIMSMKRVNSSNPVFLLDEVDKMSSDYRGDPAAALLEVLDPEQNMSFTDHYLEVPYDLSQVLFIATANTTGDIPYALRDRMEIIELSGYSEYEKEQIAVNFLLPKVKEANGITDRNITLTTGAVRKIIRSYTRESGVRELERQITAVFRKTVRQLINHQAAKYLLSAQKIEGLLGRPKYLELNMPRKPGLSFGLAWTAAGGVLLPVEAVLLAGTNKITLTGNLGEVMKESAEAALTLIKASQKYFVLPAELFTDKDVHIHVPEGAVPKDGPSAGITLAAALLSAFLNREIGRDLAMTGEITLTGRLLPVGGIKEKVLAAHRNGITEIILPAANKKDIEELPQKLKALFKCHYFNTVLEALDFIFDRPSG